MPCYHYRPWRGPQDSPHITLLEMCGVARERTFWPCLVSQNTVHQVFQTRFAHSPSAAHDNNRAGPSQVCKLYGIATDIATKRLTFLFDHALICWAVLFGELEPQNILELCTTVLCVFLHYKQQLYFYSMAILSVCVDQIINICTTKLQPLIYSHLYKFVSLHIFICVSLSFCIYSYLCVLTQMRSLPCFYKY